MLNLVLRFLAALALVFATYNPAGYSYVHWVYAAFPQVTSLLVFIGVALLIGWILFLRATLQSLGLVGLMLACAFFGSLVWLLIDQGWLTLKDHVMSYVALVLLAAILAVGMSWSHVWRHLSGQVDVDEVEG